jgi:hypothetical protein
MFSIAADLKRAHGDAKEAAAARGITVYSQVDSANVANTHLTDHLAEITGVSERAMRRATSKGMRIFTQFWDGSMNGSVTMNYEAYTGRRDLPLTAIASVAMHDSERFVNITGHGPFRGEGDLSGNEGVMRALMSDAELVAEHMMTEYTNRLPNPK